MNRNGVDENKNDTFKDNKWIFKYFKKHLANFEYIHTEHLALDKVKSFCAVIYIEVIE